MRPLVVVPPALEYLGGLFLPDFERAQFLGRLCAWVAAMHARGVDVDLEVADGSLTATEHAAALRGRTQVLVAGSRADLPAVGILKTALVRAGVPLADTVTLDAAPSAGAAAGPVQCNDLTIVSASAPHAVPAFVGHANGAFRRSKGAATGSLPHWTSQFRFVTGAGTADDEDDDRTIFVVVIDPRLDRDTDRLLADLVHRHGADAVRLTALERIAPTGAPWSAGLGVCDNETRALLLELVARWLPAHLPLLRTVCHWCDLGLDPLHEVYAGNGLPDRNRDLTENLVS